MVAVLLLTTGVLLVRSYVEAGRAARQRAVAEYEEQVLDAILKLLLAGVSIDPEGGAALKVDQVGLALGFGDFERLLREARLDPLNAAVDALARTANILPSRRDAYFHRARGLVTLGREPEALVELDRALACDARFAPALILRQSLSEKEGRSDRTGRERERFAVETPVSAWTRAWDAARRGMIAKRWEEAAAAYEELIAIDEASGEQYLGSSIESHLGRGLALLEAGDFRCVENFAVVEARTKGAVEPGLLRAKAYYLLGSKARAAETFEKLYNEADGLLKGRVALWATTIYCFFWDYERCLDWVRRVEAGPVREQMKAVILYHLGRNREALEAANEAVALTPPDDPGAHRTLALVYARGLHKIEMALKTLDEALCRDDRDDLSLYWKGFLLHTQRKYDEAKEVLVRALELNPDHAATYATLGAIAFARGDLEAGFDLFAQARAVDSKGPFVLNNLGVWLQRLGKTDDALEAYDQACDLGPKSVISQLNRAKVLKAKGRFDEAFVAFTLAAQGYPRQLEAHCFLGEAFEERGDLRNAFLQYRTGLALEPTSRNVHLALCILLRKKETVSSLGDEIGALIKTLEEVDPPHDRHPYILHLKALAHLRLLGNGDPGDLLESVEAALDAAGEAKDPDILATLAELQLVAGDQARAILTLEEALGLRRVRRSHVALLDEYSAMIPDLPSYRSIDGALERSAGEVGVGETLRRRIRAVREGVDAGSLRTYLEARLLQLASKPGVAVEKFAALAEADRSRREPLQRLIESLRESGRAKEAEKRLRTRLKTDSTADRELWNLWTTVSFVDLGRSPQELLRDFPTEDDEGSAFAPERSYRSDVRWLLEELSNGDTLRINCGGDDTGGADGGAWARDRFFAPGWAFREFLGEVRGTEADPVYRTVRSFPSLRYRPWAYRIPLRPGIYDVTLHFLEWWHEGSGMKRFDIRIEGEAVLSDYEIYESVGFATADRQTFRILVDDGTLEIDFVRECPDSDGILAGCRGGTDPWVSGIEVRRVK